MKITFLALSFVFTYVNLAAATFLAPDIIVDSKLDYDWSEVLVSKFRKLSANYNMNDPFAGNFPGQILIVDSQLGDMLSEESKELAQSFGDTIGLSFINTNTKLSLENFSYEVKGFKTDLKAGKKLADGIILGTEFNASEVTLHADKLSLNVTIPGKNGAPVFRVDIIKPEIYASNEKLINFFTKIKIEDNKDYFKLNLIDANFDQMANELLNDENCISFSYERITLPKVSLVVGTKVINFSNSKIESVIKQNHDGIKGYLLAQAADFLKKNTITAALKVIERYKLNKEFWLASSVLQSQFKLGSFDTNRSGHNLQINLPGDFCTNQKYDQLKKNCTNSKDTKTHPTRLNSTLHSNSLGVMKSYMDAGEANIVASVSEDYVNKLLVTTYDAGLWKDTLDEAGVELGPGKVVMRLDKRGDSGTLVMDVEYKPSTLERIFMGTELVRFPLVLDVSLRIEKHQEEPVVIIRLNGVDTSDETLMKGRVDLGMLSNIGDIPRFKGKILKTIRKKLAGVQNKDVIELRYPEFQGLGLEKVEFLSDGQGRMNALMKLEEVIQSEE